jgi:hypothetical protein
LGDKRSAEGGLVFNLCDDEIRIYDPAHHDRCTRFSGAFASGVGALSARGWIIAGV